MTRTARPLRAVAVCVGLALIALFGSAALVFIASLILSGFGVALQQSPLLQIGLSLVLVQGVTFGGLSVVYLSVSHTEWQSIRIPSLRDGMWILGGIVAMFGAMGAVLWILQLYKLHSAPNEVTKLGVA